MEKDSKKKVSFIVIIISTVVMLGALGAVFIITRDKNTTSNPTTSSVATTGAPTTGAPTTEEPTTELQYDFDADILSADELKEAGEYDKAMAKVYAALTNDYSNQLNEEQEKKFAGILYEAYVATERKVAASRINVRYSLGYEENAEPITIKYSDDKTFFMGEYPQDKLEDADMISYLAQNNGNDYEGTIDFYGRRFAYVTRDDAREYFEYAPIEWRWFATGKDYTRMVAVKILDCRMFNDSFTDAFWYNCGLREWLNNDFYNDAFVDAEHSIMTQIDVPKVLAFTIGSDVVVGEPCKDDVSILSGSSLFDGRDYKAEITDYAIAHDAFVDEYGMGRWWIMTNVDTKGVCIMYMTEIGDMATSGALANTINNGVRPLIAIKNGAIQ